MWMPYASQLHKEGPMMISKKNIYFVFFTIETLKTTQNKLFSNNNY